MKKVTEVCAAVKEAQAAGRIVYITDATETRKVNSVEFLEALTGCRNTNNQALIVTADYGNGESRSWEIAVTWPWNELDGWAMKDINGDLFIAPEWWFGV